MLKDIRIHLASDESEQELLEQELSRHIVANHRRNVMAFARHIPSLVSDVQNVKTQNIAIFANKNGDYNIVDYGTGRTLYGLYPLAEIQKQYYSTTRHAPFIPLRSSEGDVAPAEGRELKNISNVKDLPAFQRQMEYSSLPVNVKVMVVFGLGLGYHIEQLVKHHNIRHLIIYEPERQYFQCSVLALNWQKLLQTMEAKGTAIYLQLDKDGRDLLDNINELSQNIKIEGFYFYKHYNHAIFDSLEHGLKNNSWSQIGRKGFSFKQSANPKTYLPTWSQSIFIENFASVDQNDPTFNANLKAFKKYFPNIYNEFIDYQPSDWLPVREENGELNLILKTSLAPFGGSSPKQEALESFEHFKHFPQKDGLVLGYNGTKLKRYKHYQFVEKTESILQDIAEEVGSLPDTVKSLIMFGIGLGYQVEALFEQRDVEKLFLCEPNHDFFYASLFTIDWHAILTKADKDNCRIYINIGDDGSHLFRDLLAQFYSIGPYVLASTYFYQAYYNAHLVHALTQLREQLQVVISMGEYFDHALYGISHTTEIINRGYPLLEANSSNKLNKKQKDTPIFLVGNGPSLDDCIATIKEWQDQAIVVSCGTALMPLYKNGIVPDFHAEIEQNRSTFDWVSRIGDLDFLKQVSLVSCNGIHPDTCDLFKEVFVAFKAGESSTVSALNILGRKKYEELDYAFPTVSNFVLNLFTKIGFNQIYLFGVDLGFVDRKKHHSIQSGYYQNNGTEMYDYSEKNNTSIVVSGNFEKTVFTKHEFKVSKDVLEQTLSENAVDCFNCSNGARIKGTSPLKADDVLLVTSAQEVIEVIDIIKTTVFKPVPSNTYYSEQFSKIYQDETLAAELDRLIALVEEPVESFEDVDRLVEKQKTMLFTSYQSDASLLFYLLYGSMNYCNVLLSKCGYIKNEESLFNFTRSLLSHWTFFLKDVSATARHLFINFDVSSSFAGGRETVYLAYNQSCLNYLVNIPCMNLMESVREELFSAKAPSIGLFNETSLFALSDQDTKITRFAFEVNSQSEVDFYVNLLNRSSLNSTNVFWVGNNAVKFNYSKLKFNSSVLLQPTFLSGESGRRAILKSEALYWVKEYIPYIVLKFDLTQCYDRIVVPKLQVVDNSNFESLYSDYLKHILRYISSFDCFVEFREYLVFAKLPDLKSNLVDFAGNRGTLKATSELSCQSLFLSYMPEGLVDTVRESAEFGE